MLQSHFLRIKYFMNLTSQRYQRAVGIITVTVTIVLVANMNAIIDLFLHPDIEYFDIEHIIVGSATGIVVGIILFVLWSNIELSKNVFGNFKYSKKALAESETRYQLLAENISDVIWIMDLEIKRFRYISPSIFRLRGLTVEEAMEERFEDSLTDLSLEYINSTISDRIQQFLKEGAQSYTDVVEQKCKDGSTVWVEIKTRFGMNKENGHIEVYGVSRNISERKKIETALRLSEDKFSKAFYTSPDAINITRLSDGRYLDVNAGFTAMSGYTPEEVINKTSLELNIWNDPNDRARLVRELREKGEVSNLEAVFTLKNDRKITGLMSARIIEINGETCLLSITRDITERKKNEEALRESEKRIRTLIEQAPIGIATSRDGITLTANQVYLKMFGFEEVDELVGKSLIEQIAPQCRQEISDRVRQRALGENVESNYETIGLRKDGTEFPFLVSVSRVMLSDGPLTISFFTDITEQKKYEDTLYHTNTYLQSLINSNTRYVVRTDINGNYTYVNEPFFKKFGFTADDIIGKSATLTVLADDHEKMRMTAVK